MLIKLLSDADKHHLLDLARLLAIADKPLLFWVALLNRQRIEVGTGGQFIGALAIPQQRFVGS